MQAINAVFFSIFIWNGLIKVVNLGLIIPHKQINKISLMRPTNYVFAFFSPDFSPLCYLEINVIILEIGEILNQPRDIWLNVIIKKNVVQILGIAMDAMITYVLRITILAMVEDVFQVMTIFKKWYLVFFSCMKSLKKKHCLYRFMGWWRLARLSRWFRWKPR